ncbi:integrase [Micromonospora sp. NPDC049366]|uniref:integrase n=1 Tax=Micromonospora sp. NPDC049366 TaxID=3364271 RepID=UPI0037B7FBB1
MTWYLRSLERQLGPDRGLGDGKLRRHVTNLLRSGLGPNSAERRQLGQLLPAINDGYLDRWRDSVDAGPLPSPERLARAIATHLLDLGHSSGQLHRWARQLCRTAGASLGDLLDGACALARRPDVTYDVLVPFRSVPDHDRLAAHLPEWRTATQAADWFASNGVGRPPRQYGAFLYPITAKDPTAAARGAGTLVQRLQARASYARGETGNRLEPIGQVWIAGHDRALPVAPPARGVDVLSLVREKTMYSIASNNLLDDALEMAAPLNAGPPAPAISGGWAAIESLLSQAADAGEGKPGRVVAADRLAALVTCSWPRAELTALSYRHKPNPPDPLSTELTQLKNNMERSRAVASALAGGHVLAVSSPSDAAAVQRMAAVLANPYKELADVRTVFEGVLRRLYRQRNIVVHGGTTASVAMDATLRTAPPLVGAGLDRLVHAKLQTGVGPLELAARAANSLELVGDSLGPEVVSLLE